MKKVRYSSLPPEIEHLQGKVIYNENIVELEITDEMTEEVRIEWECDQTKAEIGSVPDGVDRELVMLENYRINNLANQVKQHKLHETGTPPFTVDIQVRDEWFLGTDEFKIKYYGAINKACESEIVKGFTSSALGSEHTYQASRDDQSNLVGRVASGIDGQFKCYDGTQWAFKPHTAEEIRQVLEDGDAVKLGFLQKAGMLRAEIDACTTLADAKNVIW